MPAAPQADISVLLMGRDALLISVSPRQNFWKPPPVPEMPTVTLTSLPAFLNSSATASLIGNTVLEPSSVTLAVPDDAPPPGWFEPPQAMVKATVAAAAPKPRNDNVMATTLRAGRYHAVSSMLIRS
jgi:hypothetical protein